jgi:uncharacterized iron-regulated membrane protein
LAATGAALVFYEPLGTLVSATFDRQPPVEPTAVVERTEAPRRPWPELLAAVRETLPEAGPAMYYPGSGANAVLTFRKSLPGEWHPNGRSYVLVNPYTARVEQAIDARAQGAGTRAMHAMYPLHAARVGTWLTVPIAALAALGLGWLALGGSWAYLGRWARASAGSPRGARRFTAVVMRDGRRTSGRHEHGSVTGVVQVERRDDLPRAVGGEVRGA